jgi:hypothetical protein
MKLNALTADGIAISNVKEGAQTLRNGFIPEINMW